jgi:hypothetical protein
MKIFIKIHINIHHFSPFWWCFYEICIKIAFYSTGFNASTGMMELKKLEIVKGIRNYDFTPKSAPVSVICPSCQTEVETGELKERKGMVGCVNCLK